MTISLVGTASTLASGTPTIEDVIPPISPGRIAFLLDPNDPDSVAFYLKLP